MFAYCLNNSTILMDCGGMCPNTCPLIMFTLGDLCGGSAPKDIIAALEESYDVTTSFHENGYEITIHNSYKIRDEGIMREYLLQLITDHPCGKMIKGSVSAVLLEWQVHNLAYDLLNSSESRNRAAHLELGYTIYNDDHGLMSLLMWVIHFANDSGTAVDDFLIFWALEE